MRLLSAFVLVSMVLLALVPGTFAQTDPTNSVTLSESFINAKIQANLPADSRLDNLYLDLQPGQIVVSATVTGGQNPLAFDLTLVPSVVDGSIQWEATVLTIGNFDMDLTQFENNPNAAQVTDSLRGVVGDASQSKPVASLTVTADTLKLTWQRADPDGPAIDIVDTAVSMTLAESYVNALPGVVNPDNPALSDLAVDFQPGQLTLTGTRTPQDGDPAPFSLTMVPTIQNGLLTWTVTALLVDGTASDAQAIGQMNDDIAGSWRMFFNGIYRSGNFADIAITDTALTLTWDSTLVTGTPSFEPGQGSLVITEDYINTSYQVTNPTGYSITDAYVDCQPGQVVITANLNLSGGRVLEQVTTFVPNVENGVVRWTVTEATLDGEPLDQAIIDRFNEFLTAWWQGVVWGQAREFQVTDVAVTEDQIEINAVSQ